MLSVQHRKKSIWGAYWIMANPPFSLVKVKITWAHLFLSIPLPPPRPDLHSLCLQFWLWPHRPLGSTVQSVSSAVIRVLLLTLLASTFFNSTARQDKGKKRSTKIKNTQSPFNCSPLPLEIVTHLSSIWDTSFSVTCFIPVYKFKLARPSPLISGLCLYVLKSYGSVSYLLSIWNGFIKQELCHLYVFWRA